jgi:hypothetical protein
VAGCDVQLRVDRHAGFRRHADCGLSGGYPERVAGIQGFSMRVR